MSEKEGRAAMNKPAVTKILLGVSLITIIALASFLVLSSNKISDLENQKNALQTQNSELLTQVNSLQNQNGALQNQTTQLQYNVSALQNQTNDLRKQIENHTNDVRILDFSSPTGWFNPVGVTMAVAFNVTVLNAGINNVEGLTLEIKRTDRDEDPFNCSRTFSLLQAGEIQEVQDSVIVSMDRYFSEFYTSSFVATLKLNGKVIDAHVLQVTERQF
jgi:hypothetical protein